MSQHIVYYDQQGIIIADDSRITKIVQGKKERAGEERKLFALGNFSCIASSGAYIGIKISGLLQEAIKERELEDFLDIYPYALDFLNDNYQEYLLENNVELMLADSHYKMLYFLIAGYSAKDDSYHVHLLESLDYRVPFQEVALGNILTMPRMLGLEMKLFRFSREQRLDLEEIEKNIRESLKEIAKINDDIGPPFYSALITRRGMKIEKF